jgi:hypothetical protein
VVPSGAWRLLLLLVGPLLLLVGPLRGVPPAGLPGQDASARACISPRAPCAWRGGSIG